MDAREIFDGYFKALEEQGAVVFVDYQHDALWTPRATIALALVGMRALASEATSQVTSRGASFGRGEFLDIDVAIVEPTNWNPPVFVAEHENSGRRERVQYAAWKLLSVDAGQRLLVAYFGDGTQFRSFEELLGAVTEVCQGHVGKALLLIGGEYDARPKTIEGLRKAHQTFAAGIPRTPRIERSTPVGA